MIRRLTLVAVLVALLAGTAIAQDPRGYHEDVVASNDFTIDMAMKKGFRTSGPAYITVRCSASCTVYFPDDDGFTARDSEDAAPADGIKIYSNEEKYFFNPSSKIRVVGALGADLTIVMEY